MRRPSTSILQGPLQREQREHRTGPDINFSYTDILFNTLFIFDRK